MVRGNLGLAKRCAVQRATPGIFGILNITRDSFSDGGRYFDADAAIEHGRRLAASGADVIDIGAESTHPDAEDVPAEEEIARLEPVVRELRHDGLSISVDAYKPAVITRALELGVDFINDVTALRDPDAVAAVRNSNARLVLMHSVSADARAARTDESAETIVDRIEAFFADRLRELASAGIARERIILDPGMGFFLSRDPRASVRVLAELPRLRQLGLPLLISTSRKSFIGALLAGDAEPRPADERGAGTLATELWAALNGADYIRTHDPRALSDTLTLWHKIAASNEQ